MGLVWRLGGATTLVVTSFSMAAPVLAVLLQQAAHGPALIGAFSMLPFLCIGLLIPVAPRVIDRFGVVRTYRGGVTLQLLALVGYALGDHLGVWVLCSVISGIGSAFLWNATETLLTQEAPPEMRGRVMGLYQTALGAALAVGPFLPAVLRLEARTALWIAAVMVAGSLVLAATARSRLGHVHVQGAQGTWRALRLVPWLAALAFAGGIFEAGLSAITAAHASAIGMDLRTATSVAGAIGVGSFLCQYPAGWLADHVNLRRVCSAAAVLLALASIGIAFAGQAPWLLWACGLVWGGVGGALYTLSIIQVAHAFDGRATAGGAAAMITGYTWGGTLGPLGSGSVLEAAGLRGLAALLLLMALAAWLAARRITPGPVSAAA
jgi:MFS family permease